MAKYLDEEDEQLIQQQEQAQQHAQEQKKNRWANIDYTKYTIPEGVTVTNAKVTRIPPKDGEQWAKFIISADVSGQHYEQEMWGNDIKAYYERDGNGNKTYRVSLDQLVAKYFGKHFTVTDAGPVSVEQEQDVPIPEEVRAGVLSRLWAFLKGIFAAHQEAAAEEQEAEPAQEEHDPYTDTADDDARIAAVRRMKDLFRVMDDYEAKIGTNNGIVANVRKMYSDRSEYISRVSTISESADHRPLQQMNAFADKALINVAQNIVEIPIVKQRIEQMTQELTRKQTQEQPQQATQEPAQEEQQKPQDEALQTVLAKMQRESVITKVATAIMAVITFFAMWQCSSAQRVWQNTGREEGRKEIAKVANARIDSLQTVIQQQREAVEAANIKAYHATKTHGGKAEVDAFFRQYDEYRQKDAKVKQLENQVSSLTRDYKELSSDYEKLRQTANSYAKEYNRMSVELAASKSTKKVKPLPEVPERKPKPAFNTIRSKDER